MSIYAALNTHPTRRDLLRFGVTFAAGMGVFGGASCLHGRPDRALCFLAAGGVVFLLSLVPPVGRVLYILWMGFGLTMGFFTVPVLMFAIYALAIVPLGLWFRWRRRDTMRRKLDPQAKTYWEDYPRSDDPRSYVRQF